MRSLAILFLLVTAGCARGPRTIVLAPIGPVDANVLDHVQLGREIALPVEAFDRDRHQYRGSALLEVLERRDFAKADRVVGIIDADVYAPGLNFIFGQAKKPGRVAVIALPRLGKSHPRFRERAAKVTVHEVGHSLGYAHCDRDSCVMRFANALGDLDRQGMTFCGRD
jgi:archaemetzincin